ncbi:TIGR00730 family Rossman fold protein [Limnohabitans sp. G3-2]|uniref:LOG family protein n=1 Tax=Limnohabitans sp. G3-2 TaxID=1100711 RepID=UPI000C1E2703|nr:TIGR00730 family Rossman fold protein [Limnohabitans sp. G3-2]PIT77945.1 Rossman fold protein, TIGR00730 family [Limnohabitans sp. G3-2]
MTQTDALTANQASPAFSLCVYCGSKPGNQAAFSQMAVQVGTWIGRHGGQLVYGGGRNGLMGLVAEATLAAGGTVIGIIPRALVEKEWAHHGCTELHVVDTMHERKRLMAEKSDTFLALPGGIGTFEELFEVWTWRQLGYHDKPIGILNGLGYYDSLLGFIAQVVEQGFMGDWQTELVRVGTEPEPLLRSLVEAAGFAPRALTEKI